MARLDKLLFQNPDTILCGLKLLGGGYLESDADDLACLIETHFPGFKRSGGKGDTSWASEAVCSSIGQGHHAIGYTDDILVNA